MSFPTASLDTYDAFTGTDGPPDAGRWSGSLNYEGGSPGMEIVSNQLASVTTAGKLLGLELQPANFEASIDIVTATAGTGYGAWFLCMVDGGTAGWSSYWLIVSEDIWTINKRVGGGAADPIGQVSSGPIVTDGDKWGIRRLDEALEVYHYTSGAWNQTPIVTATDGDLGAGVFAFDFQATDWRLDNLAVAELSGGVTGAVSLHVNADHPDATDDHVRSQVTADTPLLTILKAAQLARAVPLDSDEDSDEVVVWAAENANPDDPKGDTRVYEGFTHNFGFGFLPFGNNTGNKPIVIRGVNSDGETPVRTSAILAKPTYDSERPMWLGFDATSLVNWQFEHLHFGYEDDSGNDVLSIRTIYTPVDLQWSDCMWTGGWYLIRNASGLMRWTDCEITSRLSEFLGTEGRTLDGVGMKVVNSSETGEDFRCHFEVIRPFIHHVQGEDAFQLGTGAPDQPDTYFHWIDPIFEDIVQPGEDGSPQNPARIHTDCIQILGGPEYKLIRPTYRRCTSALIASDFRNGLIHIENAMVNGAAIEAPGDAGVSIQIQGTDRVVLVSDTMVNGGFGISVSLYYKYEPSSGSLDFTMLNCALDGLLISSDVVFGDVDRRGNLIGALYGAATLADDETLGFTEFGVSDDTILELTTTPPSPARDAGVTDELVPTTDRLGRARTGTAPDIGCHESPLTGITAVARPPHVVSVTPSDGSLGVSPTTDFVVTLLPKFGETIDESTVTGVSANLIDVAGVTIPVTITVTEPDENGEQDIRLQPRYSTSPLVDGRLYPLVTYTGRLTSAITDTEGSALGGLTAAFRIEGPDGPAIYRIDASPLVGLRQPLSAGFLGVGGTSAAFEAPHASAQFERADPTVR